MALDKLNKIQQSIANRYQQYWAKMRTNTKLAERGETLSEQQIDQMHSELLHILDSGILTYPQTLSDLKIDNQTLLEDRKKVLGVEINKLIYNKKEQVFMEDMAQKAINSRKNDWQWRISEEAEQLQKQGWFPFFVTLTIDPNHPRFDPENPNHRIGVTTPKELWQNGREFRLYIRRLVNIVCKELGHQPAHKTNTPESEYVKYSGVIEHGKSREHHHGHFLIWLRAIPSQWKLCPNRGIKDPAKRTNNECIAMRTIWKWSLPKLSPSLYFRTIGDVWEQLNFTIPINKKDGKPQRIGPPKIAGSYVTKYLQKEHKEWKHRMKATRNLGMTRLKEQIAAMPPEQVKALTWRAHNHQLNHLAIMTHSIPLGLTRRIAKQQHFLNQFRSRQLDWKTLMTDNSASYMKMLQSVRNGDRPDRMDSTHFYDWVQKHLPEQTEYCKTKYIEAQKALSEKFPREVSRINHQKLAGNYNGST